jgi:transposase
MRYELSDHEWSVIKPMLPNKSRGIPRVGTIEESSTASLGCYDRAHRGAISRRSMDPLRLVTIASFAGGAPAYGTTSWKRWPPLTMLRY